MSTTDAVDRFLEAAGTPDACFPIGPGELARLSAAAPADVTGRQHRPMSPARPLSPHGAS